MINPAMEKLLNQPHLRTSLYVAALREHSLVDEVVSALVNEEDRALVADVLSEVMDCVVGADRRQRILGLFEPEIVEAQQGRLTWLNNCDEPGESARDSMLDQAEWGEAPDWVQRRLVRFGTTPIWLLQVLETSGRTRRVRTDAKARVRAMEIDPV